MAYGKALKEEKLNIPFTIMETNSADVDDEPAFNEWIILGGHPVLLENYNWVYIPLPAGNRLPNHFVSILLLESPFSLFCITIPNLLKQQRLAALKNEFISNITHELKHQSQLWSGDWKH
ncbi:MAG: hypothetical protein IPK90_11495 [Chitinophagaceae bacterium]|nr:hypothetical protein [Chitinophagaceae bacterium]